MSGTEWVAPGDGETVGRILDHVDAMRVPGNKRLSLRAYDNIYSYLSEHGDACRTNLRLTGEALDGVDVQRLTVCEVSK